MSKRHLDYNLNMDVDNQVKFQITYQSKEVGKFFELLGRIGDGSYLSKSGYKIARSEFPEFKISQNTIYLRGSLRNQDHKVDVTRFPVSGDKTYRKGALKMFKAALAEFVGEVDRADKNGLLGGYGYTTFGGRQTGRTVNMAKLNKIGTECPKLRPNLSNVELMICEPFYAFNSYTPPAPRDNTVYISL